MAPSQDRDTSYATNNEDAGNLYMNEEETHRCDPNILSTRYQEMHKMHSTPRENRNCDLYRPDSPIAPEIMSSG